MPFTQVFILPEIRNNLLHATKILFKPTPHNLKGEKIKKGMQKKGFVDHESEGRAYRYHSLVEMDDAQDRALGYVLNQFFSGLSGDVQPVRRAAKAGHSRALLNLGFAYVRGVGVPQNYKRAREYFEMAAAKDLAEAQYNLGLIYEHGLGIDKDVPMAFKWYSLAVSRQNAPAGKALDRLIPKMSAEEIERAKRLLTQPK